MCLSLASPFLSLSPVDTRTISHFIPSQSDSIPLALSPTASSTFIGQSAGRQRPWKINLWTRNKHFHESFKNMMLHCCYYIFFLMSPLCCLVLNSHMMEKYIIESILLRKYSQKYFKLSVCFFFSHTKMWQQKDKKNKPFAESCCSFTFKYLMSSPGTSFEPDWISWQWWKNLCTCRSWNTDGNSHMKFDSLSSHASSLPFPPAVSCRPTYPVF